MTIPKNFGMSKIGKLRGGEESRYDGRETLSHMSSMADSSAVVGQGGLSFELNSASDAVALLQPPSFNVLYVSTPKIALLQTPQFRAAADLWNETVELVKPLFRFGFAETSLKTKCPYYDERFYETSGGALLPQDRSRTLINGVNQGYIYHPAQGSHNRSSSSVQQHEADSAASSSSSSQQPRAGLFGISAVAFLGSQIFRSKKQQQKQQQEPQQQLQQPQQAVSVQHFAEQHPEHAIPKGRFLVPDIPSGQLVLTLNLMAYWAITNQSRRSSMGGSMTG